MSPQTALRLSAVQCCVHLISGTEAKLPLPIYRRLPDGGRERARSHPIYDLLNYKPNDTQSSFEFRRQMTAHVMLRGNAYAQIIPGPRGPVDKLIPLSPEAVTPEAISPDKVVYHVKQKTGETITLGQSDMFHLRDLSLDGVVGMSRIEQAAQSIGLSVSALEHGSAFFRNGARPQGVLSTDKALTNAQREANLAAWEQRFGGQSNGGKTALLDQGAKYQVVGITNEQAQLLELLGFGVEDVARLYGVPAHMVGLSDKQTSWGTGVEQMTIGFVAFSAMDWLVMWESAIQRDLIAYPDTYFSEHVVDALLRADYKTRMDGRRSAIESGQMSPNEARRLENQNPRDDGYGDRYWMPQNFRYADEPSSASSPASASPVPPNGRSGHVKAAGVEA